MLILARVYEGVSLQRQTGIVFPTFRHPFLHLRNQCIGLYLLSKFHEQTPAKQVNANWCLKKD
jgi:hypothetical protein